MGFLSHVNSTMILAILASFVLITIIFVSIAKIYDDKEKYEKGLYKEKEKVGGSFINRMNHNEAIQAFGAYIPIGNYENIFNRAKNPWKMTIATFNAIRFGGLAIFVLLAALAAPFSGTVAIFMGVIGFLCFYYPAYYYKAIGNEREAEWSKMYEFIWVLKNNLTLYDPAKAYINTKLYIEEHAPKDQEIIQGFQDFYEYWNTNQIDPYISRYYNFSITREITQIVFNMNQTGDFPEESLNALRRFIINQQDLTVEKILSGVAGKATIFSLPFLMISAIIALMVPLVMQLLQFM